jgi:hypothetical protein
VQPAKPLKTPKTTRRRGSLVPVAVGAGAVVLLGGALGFSLWGDSTYDEAKAEMTDQARREAMSRQLLNLGDGRDGDHYADLVRGATATSEFSCRGRTAGP